MLLVLHFGLLAQGMWDLGGSHEPMQEIEHACQCRRYGFDPWVEKIPWRRAWQPSPVFLPRKSNGQKSLTAVHGVTKSQA